MDELRTQLDSYNIHQNTIFSIGMFDGIHLGHQHLLNQVCKIAQNNSCKSGIITFTDHPRKLFDPSITIPLITSVDEKKAFIENIGIDFVIPIQFTKSISELTYEQFIKTIINSANLKGLVLGPDTAIGFKRLGTPDKLKELGDELDYEIFNIDQLNFNNKRVSSSLTRQAISEGNMDLSTQYLGRNYSISGTVIKGKGIGNPILGYPTANLDMSSVKTILPANGIYATKIKLDGREFLGATSIGYNPTFKNEEKSIESFIIDFNENLYGKDIEINFVKWIRQEESFDNTVELQKQMTDDINQIIQLFKGKN